MKRGFRAVPVWAAVMSLLVCIFLLPLSFPVTSGAADIKAVAGEANKALRNAEKAVFSGKLDEAKAQLEAAGSLVEKIEQQDPKFSGLRGLQSKYNKLVKDVEKRLGSAGAPSHKQASEKAATAASSGKLPGGVSHRLKNLNRIIDKGEALITKETVASKEWKVKELDATVKEAEGVLDEIDKGYGTQIPAGHPEIKAANGRLEGFKTKVESFKADVAVASGRAKEADAAKESLSGQWVSRISPYITGMGQPGYDPARFLIAGATEDTAELAGRKKIFDEAQTVYEEYVKAQFPDGKTQELEMAAEKLAYSLKTFKESYASMKESFFSKASGMIENADKWLDKEAAGDDGKRVPNLLQKDIVPQIKGIVASAASADPEDKRIAEMEKRIAEIEKKDRELRTLRVKRTFMKPDSFNGPDLKAVKSAAGEFLRKDKPGAAILRTTVISGDWKEERVLEHTDTTRTAVRYRITRSVTAQIAAKTGGDVFLYSIHVAKDQRGDGTWGPLYGHVMYLDPMLEENVTKQQ